MDVEIDLSKTLEENAVSYFKKASLQEKRSWGLISGLKLKVKKKN